MSREIIETLKQHLLTAFASDGWTYQDELVYQAYLVATGRA